MQTLALPQSKSGIQMTNIIVTINVSFFHSYICVVLPAKEREGGYIFEKRTGALSKGASGLTRFSFAVCSVEDTTVKMIHDAFRGLERIFSR